ncbi:FMN-dependent NADH-azoreductase [Geodermatophilus dictyosporus]|uniref:FMN dependent NADH:quinone oxidoreductase n=1 Tax=Geodermatophilus dictyosporus TaxID=1523247 RepID=A0A1I5NNN3_9ACTN|nr:NAD(P)H-dependent oxidoreductase [Geodermatophilus dictyosporus]SFP23429.1 FMN-dependent NADH-azoreductase [Geodermatophilus dictyosporus]
MSRLLHVSASPRGARSESLALAATFLDTWRELNPLDEVDTLDLWDGSLPEFGPTAAAAKMTVFAGGVPEGAEGEAWARTVATFERFAAADRYLFSVPMWNAGIPYVLKQFIDVVSQPGMLFGFDPEAGYTGLLQGRKAVLLLTSAVYGPGRPPSFGSDFQAPYLRDWLAWAGVSDVQEVHLRPGLVTADAAGDRRRAHAAAHDVAAKF